MEVLTETVGVTEEAERVSDWLGVQDGLPVAEKEGLAEGLKDGEGLREREAWAVAVAVGVGGLALRVEDVLAVRVGQWGQKSTAKKKKNYSYTLNLKKIGESDAYMLIY